MREEDKDRFLATLFAPERYRDALLALYAFDLEIGRVSHLVKEPMAGEIRLQWWHDVISGTAHAAGSPVATALIEAMREFNLPEDSLIHAIEARREALHSDAGMMPEDLENRAMRTGAPIFELAVRVLNDGAAVDVVQLSDDAGAVFGLMRAMPSDHHARSAAAARLARASEALSQTPERFWPAFLPLAPIRVLISRNGLALPQWRRQWIIWRAARNLPSALS